MKLINKIFNRIIFEAAIKKAANNNEGEIIYHLLAKEIKSIGDHAFFGCSPLTQDQKKLKEITIPSYVTSIGQYLFAQSSLVQIIIPLSVTKIKRHTFDKCKKLSQIIIPSRVTLIGKSAFNECISLEHIVIPSSVRLIENEAFSSCKSLKYIIILSHELSIDYDPFNYCNSLLQFEIPSTLKFNFSEIIRQKAKFVRVPSLR